jgi:hypothetical protein
MYKYNKYGNIKRIYKNIKFDSIKELARYKELELLLKANKIKELEVHKTFLLLDKQAQTLINCKEPAIKFTPDFYYFDNELNVYIAEDVKPFNKKKGKFILTTDYKLRKKFFKFKYNHIKFLEV